MPKIHSVSARALAEFAFERGDLIPAARAAARMRDGVRGHQALQELLPEMEQMGFQLDSMGGNDWAINAIPAGIEGVDPVAMVQQILESVDNGGMPIKRRIMEHLSLTVARSAAIPVGRTLQQEEMEVLVADLLRLPEPNYTPDGKTIITVIPMEQITKLF
jgi:DNA mismatch repair protein MutL